MQRYQNRPAPRFRASKAIPATFPKGALSRYIAGTDSPKSSCWTWPTSRNRTACSRGWPSSSRSGATADDCSSDTQLAGKHGWNAHDYGPDGLASFFNAAAATRFPLDPEETLLRGIALREGIVTRRGDSLGPGSGAILSISRSSSKYERILLLAHESYHGVYFCMAKYRELCARTWAAAPASERRFMRRLLEYLGYDDSDSSLVVNEFQAYLLQQPRSMAPAYFERMGKLIANAEGVPEAAEVMPHLLKDEAVLEAFLMSHYAIGAGGVAPSAEGGR